MPRSEVRYAVPMSFASLAPWHRLNSAEARILDIAYDGPLRARDPRLRIDLAGDRATIEWPGFVELLVAPLAATLSRMKLESYTLQQSGQQLVLLTPTRADTIRALSASTVVPFQASPHGILGSATDTNGAFNPIERAPGRLTFRANPKHVPKCDVEVLTLTEITDPARMLSAFQHDEVDIFPIAGEDQKYSLGDLTALDGTIRCFPSNVISMLLVRDNGPFADGRVRRALRDAMPVAEFYEHFIGDQGEPVSALTPTRRRRAVGPAACLPASGRASVRAEFLLPPSERTMARAQWIAEELEARSGIKLTLRPLNWEEYWAAQRDPSVGDMIWCGLTVGADRTVEWISRGLLGGLLGLPRPIANGSAQNPCSEADALAIEDKALRDGWLIPLYKHLQCYMWRSGLRPVQVSPLDWPVPGARRAIDLKWDG